MKPLSVRVRLILIAALVASATLLFTVTYSDACKLVAIQVNDTEIVEDVTRFGLFPDRSVVKQPVDSMAAALLAQKHVFKVDVAWQLPNSISISTNNFEPVCLLLDTYTGTLCGVNQDGRMLPLKNCNISYENPILTSVYAGMMFKKAKDVRVSLVVRELLAVKEKNKELYRLIEEIDFGNKGFLKVSLDGLGYRLKVRPDYFADDLLRFVDFISRFSPDIENVKLLDLCYNDMIIAQRGKK